MSKIELSISTSQHCELLDITEEIKDLVCESGVIDGIYLVYSPPTTAGITINENADPSVVLGIWYGSGWL